MIDHPRCGVPGCPKSARFLPKSKYCTTHRQRNYRYGHPDMRTPTDRDLARHRRRIQRTLSRHFEEASVQWALRAVELELFSYRPTQGFTQQVWTSDRMQALKAAHAAPIEILQRVCECYALRRDEGDRVFPNQKAWQAFVARKVLRIKRGVLLANSNAWQLKYCGQLIDETLGRFATAALLRMDKDQAERATFDASCEDLVVGT
jgi:hypothetical protein